MAYTDLETPSRLLALAQQRQDEQIMAQEILAIALGLCTFNDQLRGKCVRIWTDNVGAECERRRTNQKPCGASTLKQKLNKEVRTKA